MVLVAGRCHSPHAPLEYVTGSVRQGSFEAVVDVGVLARVRKGDVAQIVADQPQIYLLVGHVGPRAMPKPVG
jgi:hypothetical protein